ncbi:DUF3854 domain-containing protein [Synechococcus sp. Cruz-9H2]|uniref:plasmid replication protein, CyRepA1 family n=1 Tax=unclassified Synechococcus TaxID=2626047 RepID=UPI0020CDFE2A|nr:MULTISPECIES: plasmid replication protein, CyRepA1 family [unclassified Synechococcus]MCP9821017.1 DUF3854 domain-containing protein [Synechococcus sp. Cruz-9H2]MCP9845252.1 DUF3854 domain-containing protein [Synechococcus sp. Edmonson 11F2]MCP9857423.1 DUF3854 domain-containing protein [Synechococcus sp. Cruz-9C9]MCP9864664.1 DUF3854 domain-containing protein [Synechococcus sp. Cruz-7E5]MCP9871933.1 DUF3854 domain-containing protein [Synechococcus sp. Cruz-7B9]
MSSHEPKSTEGDCRAFVLGQTWGIPTPALWDGLLSAGGPAAALDLLDRICSGDNWRRPAAGTVITSGSSWDAAAGPDVIEARHLADWIDGSACHPALAAVNLQTLQGAAAIEALVGDRLEQLNGWASQYATGAVARLLRPLEPVAAAGGWWCSGLDPLADWAPMAWGCFRPDRPRFDHERNRARKYEHPIRMPARSYWLRVPAVVAQLVADRFALALPLEVTADRDGSGGAFWRWWATEPRLPLVITEGAKKAAALLSIGQPAVALPGIWNGAPKDGNGRPALHQDLAGVPLAGRKVWVLFDHSDKPNPDEPKAARRLGRLLRAAGAAVLVGTVPGSHGKGADDHLVAGGTWQQLEAALVALASPPVLTRLRSGDLPIPNGTYIAMATKLPAADRARLVALAAAMGSGKTWAIRRHLAERVAAGQAKVLWLSHRRSLAEAGGEALNLPTGDGAAPGSALRQMGLALCIDSLRPGSGLAINPAEWRGAVVVIDELVQVLAHALTARTAIAKHRAEVLQTLAEILRHASQVIVADALLNDQALAVIEALVGCRAFLITSEHRPAAGAPLVWLPQRKRWNGALVRQLQQRTRLLIWVTAQQAGQSNAAQTLAALVEQHWPGARVLVVDSVTSKISGHPAARFAADPNGVSAAHDVVICTPAVTSGVSIDGLADHFGAVFLASGGVVPPEDVIQAAGRLRTTAPRYLFCPERTPGRALRMGSGGFRADEVLRTLSDHEQVILGQLAQAGAVPSQGLAGPWLNAWAELAAIRNAQDLAYRSTVLALLEREGYELSEAAIDPQELADGLALADQLKATAEQQQAAEDAAIAAAPLLSAAEAEAIRRKRRRSQQQSHQLRRFEVDQAWALQGATPSAELLAADRDGQAGRLRRRFWLTDGRDHVDAHDRCAARDMAPNGQHLAWDLAKTTVGSVVKTADHLGLTDWVGREGWFTAEDLQLVKLQATAAAHRAALVQVLGISPGKTATGTLRSLLRSFGYRLQARQVRVDGARPWHYRVIPEALPDGRDWADLAERWADGVA